MDSALGGMDKTMAKENRMDKLRESVVIGATGKDVERAFQSLGLRSAFLNYHGYPAELCVSVNDCVVHGIPTDEPFKAGDIVSVDYGWYGEDGLITDEAFTVELGEESVLVKATREALAAGVAVATSSNTTGDIGAAVQAVAEKYRVGIVREFVGHGVGAKLHIDPQIPNWGVVGTGTRLRRGMRLAIEPMFTERQTTIRISENGWDAKTEDGSRAAHFEETVTVA